MDNYNYNVPSVSGLCEDRQAQNSCRLAFDYRIEVNLSFSLLRTLVRLCMWHCGAHVLGVLYIGRGKHCVTVRSRVFTRLSSK